MVDTERKSWRRKYPRRARYPGTCQLCSEPIAEGAEIAWSPGRAPDHWRCYVEGSSIRRGPNEYMQRENTVGIPERVGLSERARKDLASLKRAQHSSEPMDWAQ